MNHNYDPNVMKVRKGVGRRGTSGVSWDPSSQKIFGKVTTLNYKIDYKVR